MFERPPRSVDHERQINQWSNAPLDTTSFYNQVVSAQKLSFSDDRFDDYRPLLKDFFDTLLDLERFVPQIYDWVEDVFSAPYAAILDQSWGRLRLASVEGSVENLSKWLRTQLETAVERVRAYVSRPIPEHDFDTENETAACKAAIQSLLSIERSLKAADELRTLRSTLNRAVVTASESVTDAQESAQAAAIAAGSAGGDSLSTHFDKYAKGEQIASNLYRGGTIIAIASTPALAIALPHSDTGDVVELIYRVLLVGGVGTLAAYLGRQAGQHRRTFQWARSLSVQLKSFPAFAKSAPDEETRSLMYGDFSKRILSAPPERSGDKSDPQMMQTQLIELVTLALKRT
ncbi:hypothetical protein [Clavibacter michiganensis]|uniref:hypothetical protein n=1 Tax=Clavibacter michiganensis TaxID=28447 RepID=UPI00126A2AD1|nr:hypothetical protein [Clavibacter michiganensis]